jgi:hypothetical protein
MSRRDHRDPGDEPRARRAEFPDEPDHEPQADAERDRPEPRGHLDRHPRPPLRRLGRAQNGAVIRIQFSDRLQSKPASIAPCSGPC